jgi:hypothetical protein
MSEEDDMAGFDGGGVLSGSAAVSRQRAYLSRIAPAQRWDLWPGHAVTIGRLADCEVWINDPRVSRTQATLRCDSTGWTITEDAPSSNGTFVNGRRLTSRTPIRDGDEITVGQTALTFHQEAVVGAPTAPAPGLAPSWPGHAGPPAPARVDAGQRRSRGSLAPILIVAGLGQGIALLGNGLVTFATSLNNGFLRWVLPNVILVAVAMVIALVGHFGTPVEAAEPTVVDGSPKVRARTTPAMASVLVLILVLGVGGLAVTAGARYATAYFTGKEHGVDRLAVPASATVGGVTVRVNHVWYTAHFTRVEATVDNGTKRPVSLPLYGFCSFIGRDGTTLEADDFKSQWTTDVAASARQRGTITFGGKLPDDVRSATLAFTFGPDQPTVDVKLTP